MNARNPVSASNSPFSQRPTRLERRAAETAALATQQARLKQEAADRRVAAEQAAPAKPRRGHRTTRG